MEDCKILSALRKGRVLTPARFGCLGGIPTLNITNGCLFRCAYCYARGYSQAPMQGEVRLYLNLPDLLKEELSRRKTLPQWVILNTSSDCFQPHPDILHVTYEVIRILLDHRMGISFLTKGIIPQRFFELLRRSPDKILAQIGLVSLSNRYWKGFEPNTPSPERRMENIQRLKEIGITPEVRIDPIIPFITDTKTEMEALLGRLKERGIRRITLSYLHLRPAIQRQLMEELSPVHRRLIESCFKTQEWKAVGSSTKTKLLPRAIRERGYKRIKETAEHIGITAVVCQCKNPDLKGDLCSSGRAKVHLRRTLPVQLPLFRC
ncbi:MAG: radical SAM protein [Thermodesulfobacteriota bacterium]